MIPENAYAYLFVGGGAILGFILNKLRGSTWPFKGLGGSGALLAAAGFSGAIALLTQDILLSVLFAAAYVAGESIGWNKWINCIPGTMTQEFYNQNWAVDGPTTKDRGEWGESLIDLIVDEHKHYWLYCFLGMTLRGILWWTPVAGVFVWWFSTLGGKDFNSEILLMVSAYAAVIVLGLGVLFPLTYWLASKVAPQSTDYVGWAEGLYGALYGAVLSLAVLMVIVIIALSHLSLPMPG